MYVYIIFEFCVIYGLFMVQLASQAGVCRANKHTPT